MSVPNPLPAFMPQNVRGRAVEEPWHPTESFRTFWLRKGKGEKQAAKKKSEWEKRPVSEIVIMDLLFSLQVRTLT